jgi:hypothetical protein
MGVEVERDVAVALTKPHRFVAAEARTITPGEGVGERGANDGGKDEAEHRIAQRRSPQTMTLSDNPMTTSPTQLTDLPGAIYGSALTNTEEPVAATLDNSPMRVTIPHPPAVTKLHQLVAAASRTASPDEGVAGRGAADGITQRTSPQAMALSDNPFFASDESSVETTPMLTLRERQVDNKRKKREQRELRDKISEESADEEDEGLSHDTHEKDKLSGVRILCLWHRFVCVLCSYNKLT